MTDPFPTAEVRPLRARSWAWLLPVAALLFAAAIGGFAWRARGPVLTLTARDGHGLRAGDLLAYRGIAVGEVARVELRDDLAAVELTVRLDPAAERIARAGSRFWVVRPDIGLDRLRGVETLLGARRLAVLPGAPDAEPQTAFVCLDEAPVVVLDEDDALEFTLEAPRRFGLAAGAPLTYRQIQIGSVVGVGLASDASSVEVRCVVRAPYRELVRIDSVFWESGGLAVDFQLLDGFSLDVESLRSLVVGSVALATPTRPGPPARTGHRFQLAAEPDEEWATWSPALPVGQSLLPRGTPAPRMLRARLVWEQGFFGRGQARSGWVLPVATGLLGPEDLLVPPEGAEDAALEVRGERLPLLSAPLAVGNRLALIDLAWPEVVEWPADRVRALDEAEDLLVIAEPGDAPTALDAARIRPRGDDGLRWRVDASISFGPSWHGAVVLARSDGALVGLLEVDEGRGTIRAVVGLLER